MASFVEQNTTGIGNLANCDCPERNAPPRILSTTELSDRIDRHTPVERRCCAASRTEALVAP